MVANKCAWDLIECGEYDKAINLIDDAYREKKEIYLLGNKLIAYLFQEKYDDAYELINFFIADSSTTSSSDYLTKATCCWQLGRNEEILECLKLADTAMYTDAAGGVVPAVFLTVYSAIFKDPSASQIAKQRFRKICRSKAIINWPGAIASFMLDKINQEQLIAAVSNYHPSIYAREHCQADFAIAVKYLLADDFDNYIASLKNAISYDVISCIQSEFFLAKVLLKEN